MSITVGDVLVKVRTDLTGLNTSLQGAVADVGNAASGIASKLGSLSSVLGAIGIGAAGALAAAAKAAETWGTQLEKASAVTGLSTQTTASLITGFSAAGINAQQASVMVQRFEQKLGSLQIQQQNATASVASHTATVQNQIATEDASYAHTQQTSQAHIADIQSQINAEMALTDTKSFSSTKLTSLQTQLTSAQDAASYSASQYQAKMDTLNASLVKAGTSTTLQNNVLTQLGVSLDDSNNKMKPATVLIPQIIDALGKISDPAERARDGLQIFGAQWPQLATLIKEGGKSFTEAEGLANKFGLSLSQTQVNQMEQFQTAQTQLKEAVGGFGVSIGVTVIPALTKFIDAIMGVMDKFDSLSPSTKEVITHVLEVVAAFGTLIGGSAVLGKGLGLIGSILPGLGGPISQVADKFTSFLGPIGLVAAGALGIYEAFQHVQAVHQALEPYVQALTGDFQKLGDWFQHTAIPDFATFVTTTLIPDLEELGQYIAVNIIPVLMNFGEWVGKIAISMVEDFAPILLDLAQHIIPPLVDVIGFLGQNLQIIVGIAMPFLGFWAAMKALQVAQWVGSWVTYFQELVAQLTIRTSAAVQQFTQTFSQIGQSMAGTTAQGAQQMDIFTGEVAEDAVAVESSNAAVGASFTDLLGPIGALVGVVAGVVVAVAGSLNTNKQNTDSWEQSIAQDVQNAQDNWSEYYDNVQLMGSNAATQQGISTYFSSKLSQLQNDLAAEQGVARAHGDTQTAQKMAGVLQTQSQINQLEQEQQAILSNTDSLAAQVFQTIGKSPDELNKFYNAWKANNYDTAQTVLQLGNTGDAAMKQISKSANQTLMDQLSAAQQAQQAYEQQYTSMGENSTQAAQDATTALGQSGPLGQAQVQLLGQAQGWADQLGVSVQTMLQLGQTGTYNLFQISNAFDTTANAANGLQTTTGQAATNIGTVTANTDISTSSASKLATQWALVNKAIRDSANSGTPAPPQSGASSGKINQIKKMMAGGGLLTEPIVGYGLNTGTEYDLAEQGNEAIIPVSGSGGTQVGGYSLASLLALVLGAGSLSMSAPNIPSAGTTAPTAGSSQATMIWVQDQNLYKLLQMTNSILTQILQDNPQINASAASMRYGSM